MAATPHPISDLPALLRRRMPPHPYVLALIMLGLSLALAPLLSMRSDFTDFWWRWMQASGGTHPWDIYTRAHADLPPVVLLMLTGVEGLCRRLHLAETAPPAILLVKLPNILAYLAGVPLCLLGLRRPFAPDAARMSAVCYALCLPLFVNAALWGQWDALLSLAVIGAVVALLNDRPLPAGAAMGLCLAIKLQGIVAVPVMAVYLWRRGGWRPLLSAAAVGLVVLGAILLPPCLAGRGPAVVAAYTTAASRYPQRSVSAYNGWYLLDGFDVKFRHLPERVARWDGRRAIGPITDKQLGLTMFALYTLFVTAGLWRRPDPKTLVLAAALMTFGFFMLPTEIHDRYLVPGVALLALIAPLSRRVLALFALLCVTVSLNEIVCVVRDNWKHLGELAGHRDSGTLAVAALIAVAQIGLFLWASGVYWRKTTGRRPGEPADVNVGPAGSALSAGAV